MGLPDVKHPGYTLEDWKVWDGRWELIQGIAFDMTPAPSLEHQRVNGRLHAAIFNALEEARRRTGGGECEVFVAPVDVFLLSGVVQPDLVVVCDPAKKSPRGIEGAPDLVVEILSPGTERKDLTTKRWLYEAAGVPEYVIVYPEERRAELLQLGANGLYQTVSRVEWGSVLALLGGTIRVLLGEAVNPAPG